MSSPRKVALVTGCSQGIGKAIALRLAADGFDLALNDVSAKEDVLAALARSDELRSFGTRTTIVSADVSKESEVESMIERAVADLGSLDVLVANAGIHSVNQIIDLPEEAWTRVLNINAKGPFLCFKHGAKQMIKQGRGGRLIAASSIAGKQGLFGTGAYCMSKFAIRGLIQTAALELARYKITVNGYSPGNIDTDMLRNALKEVPDSFKQMAAAHNPSSSLALIGQPEDIAHLVSFLASEGSSFVNGQTITIDGGKLFD